MKKILAPHKEQDGFCYLRFPSAVHCSLRVMAEVIGIRMMHEGSNKPFYPDNKPIQRIISSRRVEEAVETADFLKLCAEEGLTASRWPNNWIVYNGAATGVARGTTLREAYYRYKAQIAPVAIEPDYRTCGDCVYEMTSGADEPCLSCVEAGTPDGEWSRPGYKAQAGDAL